MTPSRHSLPADTGDSGPARSRLALVALALLVAALYSVMFNRDFTVDGLTYATAVESRTSLFHSNHLLFAALHSGLWEALRAISFGPERAIWLMQGISQICGVATVLAFATYVAPRAGSLRAILLAGLLAGSFAFWNFSQEPEAYVPPLLCVALSLALLRDPARVPGALRICVLVTLAVLAVLLLQQYVLWYPSLLWLLATRLRAQAGRRHTLWWVGLAIPSLCLGIYLGLGAHLGQIGNGSELAQWLLGYGYDAEGGIATYRAPPAPLARVAGLVLGLGNLVFAYEVALRPAWLLSGVLVGLLLLASLVPAWWTALRARAPDAEPILAFLLMNALFALWWESRNIEFLLPVAFAALALAGLGAPRLPLPALALSMAGVVSINAVSAFWPQRETPERYQQISALHASQNLSTNDVVIVEELNTLRWLGYFHGARPRFLPGAVSAAMHGDLALAAARADLLAALQSGHRVYTLERGAPGRLRLLAERFSVLGREGYRGEVETDLEDLYDGLTLVPVIGVADVQRVGLPGHGSTQGLPPSMQGAE